MAEDPTTPDVITVRMPSRLELLAVLDQVAQAVCARMSFDEGTSTQVSMSVIEAGTNAIQHGHARDPERAFDTTFEVHPDRLEVRVADQGAGFDPARVNGDITSPDHLLDARGRGIFIMKACMDSVDFDFTPGGTVCRLVKRRPGPAAGG